MNYSYSFVLLWTYSYEKNYETLLWSFTVYSKTYESVILWLTLMKKTMNFFIMNLLLWKKLWKSTYEVLWLTQKLWKSTYEVLWLTQKLWKSTYEVLLLTQKLWNCTYEVFLVTFTQTLRTTFAKKYSLLCMVRYLKEQKMAYHNEFTKSTIKGNVKESPTKTIKPSQLRKLIVIRLFLLFLAQWHNHLFFLFQSSNLSFLSKWNCKTFFLYEEWWMFPFAFKTMKVKLK